MRSLGLFSNWAYLTRRVAQGVELGVRVGSKVPKFLLCDWRCLYGYGLDVVLRAQALAGCTYDVGNCVVRTRRTAIYPKIHRFDRLQ